MQFSVFRDSMIFDICRKPIPRNNRKKIHTSRGRARGAKGDEWVREWLSRRAQSSTIISCMYLYPCYRFNNRDFRRKREKAELDVRCISFGAFLCACVRVCVCGYTFFFSLSLSLSHCSWLTFVEIGIAMQSELFNFGNACIQNIHISIRGFSSRISHSLWYESLKRIYSPYI